MTDILLIIAAYLLGSLSTAIIVCKLSGLPDPRTQGSGNPGATNVLRFGSKKLAIIVLLGDMLKGLLPVLCAKFLGVSDLVLAGTGFATFIGHCYPIFFSFKGGKGVATALGVMLGIWWLVGLLLLAVWLLIAIVFRLSSLAAISAAFMAPIIIGILMPALEVIVMAISIALILIWRHRINIQNLYRGTEPRIGAK